MWDAAKDVAPGMLGLISVGVLVVVCEFVIRPNWRRLREAWRDVNRPLR